MYIQHCLLTSNPISTYNLIFAFPLWKLRYVVKRKYVNTQTLAKSEFSKTAPQNLRIASNQQLSHALLRLVLRAHEPLDNQTTAGYRSDRNSIAFSVQKNHLNGCLDFKNHALRYYQTRWWHLVLKLRFIASHCQIAKLSSDKV